jgi:ketosteroid isomerase-like protein
MKSFILSLTLLMIVATSCRTGAYSKQNQVNENMKDRENMSASSLLVVEKFNAAFNRHNVDEVMDLMTEDCIFETTNPAPDGARLVGAVEVRGYWENFFARNPDARFETEEIFAVGDRCVVRWIYRKSKDGKPWHLRGVDIFKIVNGKVAQKLSYVKG